MRKLYLAFIFAFILALILASYATFFTQSKPITSVSKNPSIESTGSEPSPTPNRSKITTDGNYERAAHMVDGREFVLVSQEVGYDIQMQLVERVDGSYYPLSAEYSWVNAYIDENTGDFWFDTNGKNLYLSKYKYTDAEVYLSDQSEIFVVNYSDINKLSIKSIAVIDDVIYGSAEFIDFNSEYNSFVMRSMGGDACSGWGKIYLFNLKSKSARNLIDTGIGCAEGNRYFGYQNKKLILGEDIACGVEQPMPGPCLKNIYSVDPFNFNQKKVHYQFKAPYEYGDGYSQESISEEEVVVARAFKMPDTAETYDNYGYETFALNWNTGAFRVLAKDTQPVHSSFEEYRTPEIVTEVLRSGNPISIIKEGDNLIVKNESDNATYLYRIITEADPSDWSPCGDGCDPVYPGDENIIDLQPYYIDGSADIFWWNYNDNPQTKYDIPENNTVKVF